MTDPAKPMTAEQRAQQEKFLTSPQTIRTEMGQRFEDAVAIHELRTEVERLKAFKRYVHKRLDIAGVPADPPGEHREAGCRIGQRLDLLLNGKGV